MMQPDSTLSVKDASGRQISLLNDQQPTPSLQGKRKYHCTEPGCHKSFTTSGHLARHHRIHTGEKNFHCLHPGCPSRFSRQDNMMQHYRTHLAPKSRRQQQLPQRKGTTSNEYPRLHCHTIVKEEHSAMHPLINTPAVTTRSRRATTLPSTFYPYPMDYFYMKRQVEKPLAMEPDSAPSSPNSFPDPTSCASSSSSFLSPRLMSPLLDPTDIIYPKPFIQLPPPLQSKNHHFNNIVHHRQGLADLALTVSIFG